jgi:hypothetical protein
MRTDDYQQFAAALAGHSAAPPNAVCCSPPTVLDERWAIYRNNVYMSLIEALADNFPTVVALVGREFFDSMTREYVANCKPSSPSLLEYGRDFPEFIESFHAARGLPYLADVSRLDLAWLNSWSAADAQAMQLADLQAVAADALLDCAVETHPAARLVVSEWPIASIWHAHQTAEPDLTLLQWKAECALITRPEAEVLVSSLNEDQARCVQALCSGHTIGVAAVTTLHRNPNFDIGAALGLFIELGMIQRICAHA